MVVTVEEINTFIVESFSAASGGGTECMDVGEDWAVARWTYDETTLRPGRLISGPTMFALADSAFYFAVFGAIGIEPMAVTSQLSLTFLRPAQGGDLWAKARLLRVGRNLIYGEVALWVEGDPDGLVAHATGTYVRPRA